LRCEPEFSLPYDPAIQNMWSNPPFLYIFSHRNLDAVSLAGEIVHLHRIIYRLGITSGTDSPGSYALIFTF